MWHGRRTTIQACVSKPTVNTQWSLVRTSRRASTCSHQGRCNGRAISAAVLHHAPPPEPAMRTARHVDGRQAANEGLRILARLRVGSGHRQQSPHLRQPPRLGCRCQQPLVADALEARGQDMLQDARCNSSQHHSTFCTLMESALPQIFSKRGLLLLLLLLRTPRPPRRASPTERTPRPCPST